MFKSGGDTTELSIGKRQDFQAVCNTSPREISGCLSVAASAVACEVFSSQLLRNRQISPEFFSRGAQTMGVSVPGVLRFVALSHGNEGTNICLVTVCHQPCV